MAAASESFYKLYFPTSYGLHFNIDGEHFYTSHPAKLEKIFKGEDFQKSYPTSVIYTFDHH